MGPCTANARRPTVDSRCRGTTISCCVADLRRCLPTTSVTGVQQSTRYCGALPCRHLCMMTPSLYVTRPATSSQCRSSCKIVVRPRSNFLVSLTTRVAAFINTCNCPAKRRIQAFRSKNAFDPATCLKTRPENVIFVDHFAFLFRRNLNSCETCLGIPL